MIRTRLHTSLLGFLVVAVVLMGIPFGLSFGPSPQNAYAEESSAIDVSASEANGPNIDPALTTLDANSDSSEPPINVAPWHRVHLTDGQTYDVSTASANTTVYIDKPGTYTLKGSSTHMRLEINSGGVTVYLKDGLRIDPGVLSYVGSRTAAVNIGDQGGTVRLVSKPAAQVYFGSYLFAPAIRKDGKNTQLIFETEDPNRPGTIRAHSGKESISAAIGSVGIAAGTRKWLTGNMVFNSGTVIAEGGSDSAAIGGGKGMSVDGITINGGTVTATALSAGAGIGGGLYGDGSNITINGGTVTATAGEGIKSQVGYSSGAGIGGGSDGAAHNITINGGTVTARQSSYEGGGAGIGGGKREAHGTSSSYGIRITGGTVRAEGSWNGGAGIGAGFGGAVRDITITGGTITAHGGSGGNDYSGGNGIGGGGGAPKSIMSGGVTAANITISGGNTTATAGQYASGIGNSYDADKDSTITISGGIIHASGASHGWAIGGSARGSTNVNIFGGTIVADGKTGTGIGSRSANSQIQITGGSIRSSSVSKTPVNSAGNPVSLTTVTLEGAENGSGVTAADIAPLPMPYGIKDVQTMDTDKLYFWLPAGSAITKASAHRASAPPSTPAMNYVGNIAAGATGTLHLVLTLPLIVLESPGANGLAHVVRTATKVTDIQHAQRPGYSITGYSAEGLQGATLMHVDGTFEKDIAPYTDASGAWVFLPEGTQTVYLVAQWQPSEYTVHFDANRPKGASTTPTGDTPDQIFKHDETKGLTPCGFMLPGYSFAGWNTAPDGTGTTYANEQNVTNLATDEGAIVTLYAQWTPRTYTVTFQSGEASPTQPDYTQVFTFDQAKNLDACQFAIPNKVFVGWTRAGIPSGNFYVDEATVLNACTVETDGSLTGYTLVANWVDASEATLVVTTDDVLEGSLAGAIVLGDSTGATYRNAFTENVSTPGIYSYSATGSAALPPGTYDLFLDAGASGLDPTGKTVTIDANPEYIALAYYTVQVAHDMHLVSAAWSLVSGYQRTGAGTLLDGATVQFSATETAGSGYLFSRWNSTATDPEAGWDATANPTIVVIAGTTILAAESTSISYFVAFEANGGVPGPAGPMLDQKLFYDISSPLMPNEYTLTGYSFTGWNTQPDGLGASYTDGESVSNLVTEDGAIVTLYAQWRAHTYKVFFHNNAGVGMMPAQQLTYDEPQTLLANQFGRPYWHFTGWNTDPGGTGTAYEDGQNVENLAAEEDAHITLYAQWEHDFYTVNYVANGGSGTMDPQALWCNTDEALYANGFVWKNHTFIGWNTAANGSGTSYAAGEMVKDIVPAGEEITLYAQWAHDVYTVVYNANGGTGSMDNQIMPSGEVVQLSACTFTRGGFTFTRWNTAADGSGTYYDNGAKVSDLAEADTSITLYAQWAKSGDGGGLAGTGDSGTLWLVAAGILFLGLALIALNPSLQKAPQ